MFPLLIPMAGGALVGAMLNKDKPMKGALMGAALGGGAGAAAPMLGGLLGSSAGAAGAGAASGAPAVAAAGGQAGAAAAAQGTASATSLKGLLGTANEYAPLMNSVMQSMGGSEQQMAQAPAPSLPQGGAETLAGLAGQRGDPLMAASAQARANRRNGRRFA